MSTDLVTCHTLGTIARIDEIGRIDRYDYYSGDSTYFDQIDFLP